MSQWMLVCCSFASQPPIILLPARPSVLRGSISGLEEKYSTLVAQESELEQRYQSPRTRQVSFADEKVERPKKAPRSTSSILRSRA